MPLLLVMLTLALSLLYGSLLTSEQSGELLFTSWISQISSSWSPSTGILYVPDASVSASALYVTLPPSLSLHSNLTFAPTCMHCQTTSLYIIVCYVYEYVFDYKFNSDTVKSKYSF
ncbi:hypothetical protein PanWU01x14_290360, partial [Parasponia andersonii]